MITNIDFNSYSTTTLLVSSVTILGSLAIYYNRSKHQKEFGKLPLLKNINYYETVKALSSKELPYKFLQWSKETGDTFEMKIPFSPYPMFVVSGELNLCRKILTDKTSERHFGLDVFKIIHDGGDDILTSEGSYWKHSRKFIAPAFASKHIKRMNGVSTQRTESLIKKLDMIVEKGESLDICDEFLHLTLSIIGEAAFEYELSLEDRNMFLSELHIVFTEARKGRMPLRWKFGAFIPDVRRAREGGKTLLAFGLKILESYRQLESPQKGTVIDCIANNQHYKNDKERASDILVLFVGGHDTTAFTIAWTLLELAKNPLEQAKLQRELKSIKSVEDRASSTALNCVIKESQRLRPVLPLASSRRLTHDVIINKNKKNGLKKDVLVPTGSVILCPQILLNRNPNHHKDPDVFKPSRWINPSEEALASLMPFSLGRRNCIGQSLAKGQLGCVLSRLCTDYIFSIDDEGTQDCGLTDKPLGARLFVSKAT
jgi:cytochrome P450